MKNPQSINLKWTKNPELARQFTYKGKAQSTINLIKEEFPLIDLEINEMFIVGMPLGRGVARLKRVYMIRVHSSDSHGFWRDSALLAPRWRKQGTVELIGDFYIKIDWKGITRPVYKYGYAIHLLGSMP